MGVKPTWVPAAAEVVGVLALGSAAALLAGCGGTASSATSGASARTASGSPAVEMSTSSGPQANADCRPDQLHMTYLAGLQGAGNNFGTIVVTNTSAVDCVWRGGVSVSPMTASQLFFPDPIVRRFGPQSATLTALRLSAHGHVDVSGNYPGSDHIAEIIVSGDARDGDGANGLCPASHEVTPAYWGIATEGAKFTVANNGPNVGGYSGVTACRSNGLNKITVDGRP